MQKCNGALNSARKPRDSYSYKFLILQNRTEYDKKLIESNLRYCERTKIRKNNWQRYM